MASLIPGEKSEPLACGLGPLLAYPPPSAQPMSQCPHLPASAQGLLARLGPGQLLLTLLPSLWALPSQHSCSQSEDGCCDYCAVLRGPGCLLECSPGSPPVLLRMRAGTTSETFLYFPPGQGWHKACV